MEADFTLVPFGGLGNRMYAICSAIAYCQKNKKSLKIIWFRDHNLNCSVSDLFTISAEMEFVDLKDASLMDLILRDNLADEIFGYLNFFKGFYLIGVYMFQKYMMLFQFIKKSLLEI